MRNARRRGAHNALCCRADAACFTTVLLQEVLSGPVRGRARGRLCFCSQARISTFEKTAVTYRRDGKKKWEHLHFLFSGVREYVGVWPGSGYVFAQTAKSRCAWARYLTRRHCFGKMVKMEKVANWGLRFSIPVSRLPEYQRFSSCQHVKWGLFWG